jgi:2-polyprenyl-3-methyl-5-hydroxy-6-metoxy-1,4-benzoquinol methylase
MTDWKPLSGSRPGVPIDSDFPVAMETPHHQAWGIPSSFPLEQLPLRMTDAQLQSIVLSIWHEFMLHDEVLSAISFLENAPYRVRHTAETEKALLMTRSTMEWMKNKIHIDSVNTPSDPNGVPFSKEVANPLPEPLTGAVSGRYNWILSKLPSPGCSIVDFGCIDGTMTNRWALAGYKVTGVDMSWSSVSIANAKSTEFNTGARHVCSFFRDAVDTLPNNSFDAFTCADTYEHVTDPVNDLLVPARKLLKGDGRALLVTPHGAWFRGQFVPWGHPWIWYNEGHTWLARKPRAHLVAPTVWTVADHFRKAGFWVKESSVVLQGHDNQDVPGQGNVCVEAIASTPPVWPGYSFSFLDSSHQSSMMPLASTLASMGHSVRFYKPCSSPYSEGVFGFVDVMDISKSSSIKCDVLVTSESIPPGSHARHASAPTHHIDLLRLAAS